MAESNSQAREQFEAHARKVGLSVERTSGREHASYVEYETAVAWDSWQAALSSISAERDALRAALERIGYPQ